MPEWEDRTSVFQTPGISVPEHTAKRDRAYLIVLAGHNVGEMFRIEREITVIGRSQRADVRVVDEGISREHARLRSESGRLFLEDMGSTNGTFCNGVKVSRQELAEGDKILIGSTTVLKFTYSDDLDESFQRQMYESALRDGLTHAFNKKYLVDRLESEFAFAVRHQSPLTLILFDIDHFKAINDTHGHPVGDFVLSELARVLSGALRAEDVFARYGGEEFAVICRGIELEVGRVVAERLRRLIEAKTFEIDGRTIPVTISVGVAALPDAAADVAADLVAATDAALYEAKHGGRNRVCVHKP